MQARSIFMTMALLSLPTEYPTAAYRCRTEQGLWKPLERASQSSKSTIASSPAFSPAGWMAHRLFPISRPFRVMELMDTREIVVAPTTAFTRAPEGYSFAEAATLTTAGVTAWRALVVNGALKAGDTVLVLGTGGVSIFALQIAKAMGATVFVTSSSDEKLQRARSLDADHTINYRHHPDWGTRVREMAGGVGVDHVIEVGGPGTLGQSIAAVAIGGHIALIGVLTGRAGEVATAQLMAKQARLHGLIVGSRKHQMDFVRGIDAAGIKPVIDRSFNLDEIADAFRYEASGQHFGKICLEF
jgi:NADPH:quinone reductase-like Zn-dependent oxidoreductase